MAQAAAAALSLGAEVPTVPTRQEGHSRRYSNAALTTTVRRPTGSEEGERLLGKMERRAAVSIFQSPQQQTTICLANVLNVLVCAGDCVDTRNVVVAVQHWQITMLPKNSKRRRRQCVELAREPFGFGAVHILADLHGFHRSESWNHGTGGCQRCIARTRARAEGGSTESEALAAIEGNRSGGVKRRPATASRCGDGDSAWPLRPKIDAPGMGE